MLSYARDLLWPLHLIILYSAVFYIALYVYIHVFIYHLPFPSKGFPCGSAGKEFICNEGDLGLILGWEDPLEKRKATH